MATKSRKTAAAKKSPRRTSTARKAVSKKSAARKAGTSKVATQRGAAKKAGMKKAGAARPVASKAGARKTASKGEARKAAPRPDTRKTPLTARAEPRTAPTARAERSTAPRTKPRTPPTRERPVLGAPLVEQVETSSAGIQPLAPEHAAVDELTSSGNELLDIFQRYDRNRSGSIERAEFARLLEALGQNVTDEELEIAVDTVDTERTGKVSWKAFKAWWTRR